MKVSIIIILLSGLLFSGCQTKIKNQRVKRFGSITGLKADKLERYKELHANAWPEVLKKIKDCHIQNYSIYLQKIKNEYYLFSYFEYTGEDFDGDMKKMAADSKTQQWWKETDPCQQPLPETAAKKEIWTTMEEVFHTN
ncbi:L-rhamnose mutarotase [Pedobacter sp. HMWF019]|uniref:L-rhamnose mutarotase n=1 Tax=Pedobacter sp. HMWF019 TaxID=2056856 RepID=UPI000D36E7EA|nr:L-rhamnose mutarotase [Pedobacter sp. HMWF019]PTS99030.1 L-rhamnose mutarotase [Pedobacter sp. HMWF019]